MTWEEWEKAYPVNVVTWEPKHYIEKANNRRDAEALKDAYEVQNECGGLVVVQYKDDFYVILNDEYHYRAV